MTLRRQATAGVFWVGVSTTANNFFSMLTRYILARMLLPAQFGLVSMAYIAIDFLQMFREMGFSSALIYYKGDMRKAADTTFVVTAALAGFLFILAFLGAPLVGTFFRSPELVGVLRALSVNIPISALGQVQFSLLAKNMAFKEKLLPDLIPTVVYGVVAVTLALMGLGVWSIVIARIADTILTSVLAWIVVPWWRPRWAYDPEQARELFNYGKHIVGSGVLIYFITNLDNTFIGRVLGEEQLGYYGFAYNLANLPATHISRLIGQVLFPAYSRIRDDMQMLRSVFFRTLHYVSLVAIPVAIGTIVFAAPFIETLYGERWSPATLPLQILGIYGLLRAVAVNMGSVFKAGGKPVWLTYIALLRLVVMALFLYPATKYFGVVGVSVLSAGVSVADFLLSSYLTNRIVRGSWLDYVRALALPLVLALVSAALAKFSYARMAGGHGFIALATGTILMGVSYSLAVFMLDGHVRRFVLGLLTDAGEAGRRLLNV